MSFSSKVTPGIPADTYAAARRVYNIQHIYLRIGDHLAELNKETDLLALNPTSSLKPDTVLRLALVTAFQYAERLTDAAASEAVLRRMDWKYALYLPINYPGIAPVALCEFRQSLMSSSKGLQEFARLLNQLAGYGLFARSFSDSLDPGDALSTICTTTRFNMLQHALKTLLSMIVSVEPDWLREHALPHWYERYKTGSLNGSTQAFLNNTVQEATTLGADIYQLLSALRQDNPFGEAGQAEMRLLARLWGEQYFMEGRKIQWRLPGCNYCLCHLSDTMTTHFSTPITPP
jgi:hypothetical protein